MCWAGWWACRGGGEGVDHGGAGAGGGVPCTRATRASSLSIALALPQKSTIPQVEGAKEPGKACNFLFWSTHAQKGLEEEEHTSSELVVGLLQGERIKKSIFVMIIFKRAASRGGGHSIYVCLFSELGF